jgi:hypothetical protein
MSLPPDNVAPGDLWAQIIATPRPSRIVDFPRNGEDGKPLGQIRLRTLTQSEQMESASAAERVAKKFMREAVGSDQMNHGYESVFRNASAVEILFRASFKVDEWRFFFPSPDEMRKRLSVDEIGILMHSYMITQAELGPIVSQLSESELEAWIHRLSEGGSRVPLAFLSSEAQSELLTHMASLIQSFRTDKSLRGLPLDGITLETRSDEITTEGA